MRDPSHVEAEGRAADALGQVFAVGADQPDGVPVVAVWRTVAVLGDELLEARARLARDAGEHLGPVARFLSGPRDVVAGSLGAVEGHQEAAHPHFLRAFGHGGRALALIFGDTDRPGSAAEGQDEREGSDESAHRAKQ